MKETVEPVTLRHYVDGVIQSVELRNMTIRRDFLGKESILYLFQTHRVYRENGFACADIHSKFVSGAVSLD